MIFRRLRRAATLADYAFGAISFDYFSLIRASRLYFHVAFFFSFFR